MYSRGQKSKERKIKKNKMDKMEAFTDLGGFNSRCPELHNQPTIHLQDNQDNEHTADTLKKTRKEYIRQKDEEKDGVEKQAGWRGRRTESNPQIIACV